MNTTEGSTSAGTERVDVAIVGGGHNALVAATYLARSGLRTVVLERLDHTGGAAVSAEAFAGVPARLSRYSYLVSLMPPELITDLGLRLELRSRTTAAYTPIVRDGKHTGLMVERRESTTTEESFRALTGSGEEYAAWTRFYADVAGMARAVWPTLLSPLPTAAHLRAQLDARTWESFMQRPLSEVLEDRFKDDEVRGVVATDGLIGTFASVSDPSLRQNRCFLYHLIGNGTGEWRVPVGGMGAVTDELARVAHAAGAELRTDAEVTSIDADETGATLTVRSGDSEYALASDWVLSGAAPSVLARLRGRTHESAPGAQVKINLLVRTLPRLRSGADPTAAFAGTLHLAEGYDELERAYRDASTGELPTVVPGEMYCHSLTDPSILGDDLAARGYHTFTFFGLHTPPEVFEPDVPTLRDEAVRRVIAALDEHLEEPLESILATDAEGRPCLEAKTPQDVEEALAMPGGNIFHGDLDWPWLDEDEPAETPAQRWGVSTPDPRILICGAGAQRGGAVSGLGGHNAAHALLESLGRART
ncbi:MAG: phytoene desaturase family protein [Nocardioidaceae bacterium]